MPFIFYAEYITGNLLLMQGAEAEAVVNGGEISLAWFESNLESIVLPLYTGAVFCATLLSVVSFLLVNRLWVHSVHKERAAKKGNETDKKSV